VRSSRSRPCGTILGPIGRCRELIRHVDPANWETMVILPGNALVRLADLLPHSEPATASPRATV